MSSESEIGADPDVNWIARPGDEEAVRPLHVAPVLQVAQHDLPRSTILTTTRCFIEENPQCVSGLERKREKEEERGQIYRKPAG